MVCVMLVIPVMAASSFFSKSTTKLNAFNGGTSSISTFTSGSVFGSDPTISDIRLSLNVSRGTDPYTLYIQSPEGTLVPFDGSASSTSFYTDAFQGENPSGTWRVYIQNSGISTNGNVMPVSTVTITATVYYNY